MKPESQVLAKLQLKMSEWFEECELADDEELALEMARAAKATFNAYQAGYAGGTAFKLKRGQL